MRGPSGGIDDLRIDQDAAVTASPAPTVAVHGHPGRAMSTGGSAVLWIEDGQVIRLAGWSFQHPMTVADLLAIADSIP